MASRADKAYQDPLTAGSLSSALRLWQNLRAAGQDTATSRISFTLSCRSESRATRVAGFLRRRRACEVTRVDHVAGAHRDTWHVHGSLHATIHALPDLEAAWTWLRRTANNHQVALLRVTIAPAAA